MDFACSHCGQTLRVPDGSEGRSAKCPACGGLSTVPGGPPPVGGGENWEKQTGFAGSEFVPDPAAYAAPFASAAKSKLLGPAIGLMVAAGVNLLIILGRFALGGTDVPPPPPDADPSFVAGYQIGAKAVIGVILLGGITNMVTLLGSVMMLQLKMRGLAVTGAILAMVPCLSCCWPLGLGMGIWALVALQDPRVRAAFT